MAMLICTADGNLTDAATWSLASDGTGAQLTTLTASTLVGASYTYSSAFTGTNTHIVDGVAIFLSSGGIGTFSVALSEDNGTTATREVTVNASDLPTAASWVFFKFGSTLTLDGGTDYKIGVKSPSASVTVFRDATAANWGRLLRRTTTQAPAAGDTMLICGEWTAASTVTARTVTMNETASTDYGTGTATATAPTQTNTQAFTGLQIGQSGTLTWGTTAATNYLLRLSGNLVVWSGGTYNQGTTGTPCPRDSTMTLEFDCAADGDFGFLAMQGATVSKQGLSRTSGKDVWWALLSGGGHNIFSTGANTGFAYSTTNGSPIATSITSEAFGTFAVGDAIGQNNSTAVIPAGTTILGYRDNNGNNFGDTTGISASSSIRMSANASQTQSGSTAFTNGGFIGSTLLTVNADTGWLSGDRIAIASTTRLRTDCEERTLSSNATSTQLPISALTVRHDGVSPVQAEVILLTRNVKVRSTLSTAMTYCFFATTATADLDWVEFRYIGLNTASKRGLEITTTTGSFDMRYSAISDGEFTVVYITGATFNNVTLRYNAIYNTGTSSGAPVNLATATSGTSWNISDNIVMLSASGNGFTLSDVGGTFQNNRAIGAGSSGFSIAEANTIGPISGLVAHSCASIGISASTNGTRGVVSNTTTWRNSSSGVDASSQRNSLTFNGLTAFGNLGANLSIGGDITLIDAVLNGDTSFATSSGVQLYAGKLVGIGCDFSTTSGIKTAHTDDVVFSGSATVVDAIFHNSKFGAASEVASQSNLSDNSSIASMNHDQVAGAHRTYKRYGTITRDTTIYNTASPSERLTPNNASAKLSSGSRLIGVDSGATKTISVYVRKSVVGDGAAYNGAEPRLMMRRQDIMGYTSDTALDTMTSAAGSWEQLSATTAAASQDGVFEVYVDCDGTAGWVNVDDWSVS
jgi:hypothetical protein